MKIVSKACGLLAMFLAAQGARADFSIVCGPNREKGVAHSSVAFINEGADMKVYVGGKAVAEDSFGIKGLDGDRWMVSIDHGPDKDSQQFIFTHAKASVQEYSISDDDKETKVGSPQKCIWKEPGAR